MSDKIKFSYVATKEGKKIEGTIEALDRAAALKTIVEKGYRPISLSDNAKFDPNNLSLPSFLQKKSISLKDLVAFTRQLSTMINAGVPLLKSLDTLKNQTESQLLSEALEQISADIRGGSTLSKAMGKHPKIFSAIYINMVNAGEVAGILDDVLNKLAVQQEKEATIKKKIKSASTYPKVLIGITFMAFFVLMTVVVPKIGEIIIDLGGEDAELPALTATMLSISDFATSYWYIVIGGAVGLIVSLKKYLKTPTGKRNLDKLLLKMPVAKNIVVKVALARFSRTFSSLMASGVTVLESITITSKAMGNVIIEEALVHAAKEVRQGAVLSEVMAQNAIFPPILTQMLAIGEETGELDTVLNKVADFYEEEVDAVVESISSIIEPVMIVILGGMVGLIAVSVIGPISSLSQNVG